MMLRIAQRSGSVPRPLTFDGARMLAQAPSTSKSTQKSAVPPKPSSSASDKDGSSTDSKAGPKKSGGGFRKLKWTFYGLTGLSAVGSITVLLADNSTSARKSIEDTIPYSDRLFTHYLGKPGDRVIWNAVKRKVKGEPTPAAGKIAADESMMPKKNKPTEYADAQKQLKGKDGSKSSDDEKLFGKLQLDGVPRQEAVKNLEERLKAGIAAADKKLRQTLDTKNVLIQQINSHAKKIRQAINEPTDEYWSHVAQTKTEVDQTVSRDGGHDADAKNYIDMLKSIVREGKSHQHTSSEPVLEQAQQVIGDMTYALQEAQTRVKKAQLENKIMNDYKTLIEQSRKQFADELRAIVPDVDKHAKENKLSVDELNALIAHAHLRIDHLRKQITEQKLREEQHIHAALEQQKSVGAKLTDEQLEREIKRMEVAYQLEAEQKLAQARADFEAELRSQLRRASSQHAEHLEQLLKAQEEELNSKTQQLIEDAVKAERAEFHAQMAETFEKLNAVEAALAARAQQDAENRRAKQLWLACQNLTDSIVHGRKDAPNAEARRKPLANQLLAIREASAADPFVSSVFESITDDVIQYGVYTEDDLRDRFNRLDKLCRRTALIDDNGGSLWKYAVSALQSTLLLDIRHKSYTTDDVIDINNIDTYEIIQRAHYHLYKHDDLTTAIRLLSLLRGEPARLARDWLRDARNHLEAKQAANLLMAHAASLSCETVY